MKTKEYVFCGLLAAILCLSAFITIPLPFTPIPITLQIMAICVSGGVLGRKKGVLAVAVYLLIGFIGLPVFSGMKGGPGVLFGPTGGYIIGFLPGVFLIGLMAETMIKPADSMLVQYRKLAFSMSLGVCTIYAVGTLQLMLMTGMGLMAALLSAVIPFAPLDCFKIAMATVITYSIKNRLMVAL